MMAVLIGWIENCKQIAFGIGLNVVKSITVTLRSELVEVPVCCTASFSYVNYGHPAVSYVSLLS
jgi:hypothetical protein